jgi:hypothetical protein
MSLVVENASFLSDVITWHLYRNNYFLHQFSYVIHFLLQHVLITENHVVKMMFRL